VGAKFLSAGSVLVMLGLLGLRGETDVAAVTAMALTVAAALAVWGVAQPVGLASQSQASQCLASQCLASQCLASQCLASQSVASRALDLDLQTCGPITQEWSGGDFQEDSSIDSGIVGPELEGQDGSDLLNRAKTSGALTAQQITAMEEALAKNHSSLRALKAMIATRELTKFQAMHLLWGQESKLRFGDYVLVEVIGRGSSSTVYRARDHRTDESIAIKILHADAQAIKRVKREMQSVRKLAHPNIVVAYDCGQIHARFFIAMELISGSDLHQLVRDDGPLDERTALVAVLQIALALQQAHERGVLHRDVKPGNMLLTATGQVKLADLGLSCPIEREDGGSFETAKNSLGGTLEFMAPEQAHEFRNVDARADTFALGSSLFFLLTGHSRLPGKNLAERINNLTVHRQFLATAEYVSNPEIAELIDRLAAFEVEKRIGSVSAAVEAIRQTLSQLGDPHETRMIRVLVVEDNQDDMYITLRMLAKTNRMLETVEAACMADALAACDPQHSGTLTEAFDIALLDANLPDSRGLETVERFCRFAPQMAVIVLSGSNGSAFQADCLTAGADSYLCKDDLTTDRLEHEIFVTLARRRVALETQTLQSAPSPPRRGRSKKRFASSH
jgi:serine/threonine-protein kinase